MGQSMLNIRKIQYRMRLWDVREEASAVKNVLGKVCSTYEKYNIECVLGMFVRGHLLLKSMGESMLNIRKIQCRMRLGGVLEEASAVRKYGAKYAQHTKNTI